MNTLFDQVRQRREQLWQHSFATTMRDASLPGAVRWSCVPHMTFFIMGFKDMLYDLQRPQSDDPIQHMVNEHCQEDDGHWKWFLNDLERIKLADSPLERGNWHLFADMWSEENWAIRNMVYDAVHLGRSADSPRLRMLMLEVIEAVFSVYAESIKVLVLEQGQWETLEFFGKVHYDAENDHSSGSWLDGGKDSLESEAEMTTIELEFGRRMITYLFDDFEAMFDRWNAIQQQARGTYLQSA